MKINIKERTLGSLLKLTCYMSVNSHVTDDNSKLYSYNVNNLAHVHLRFECSKGILKTFMNAQTHEKVKDFQIKVKVCGDYDGTYSEWICSDDGQYKLLDMPVLDCNTYDYLKSVQLNLTVSARKVFNGLPVNLYNDVDFTDFQLSFSEGTVAIHRAYLAAHSDVFKKMLSQEWKETKEGSINIPGVTLRTLQHLKRYMYLGVVPNEDLQPLLLIASCYLMEEFKTECILKLVQTTKAEDLYDLLKFAVRNELPELVFAIMSETREPVAT